MECIPSFPRIERKLRELLLIVQAIDETKQFSSKQSNLFYGKSFGHSHVYFILVFAEKLGRGANWCFNCHPCSTRIFYYELLLIQHFQEAHPQHGHRERNYIYIYIYANILTTTIINSMEAFAFTLPGRRRDG